MVISDTSFIIDLMRNDSSAIQKSDDLESKNEPVAVTVLSLFELHRGLARSKLPEKEKNRVADALKGQRVLVLDEDAAILAGEIMGELDSKGIPIGPIDCLIASIARREREPILTKNVKDFKKVPGLIVETY